VFRRNSILANSSTNRTLTANRFHAVGSPASTAQAIRLASLAELHSGCLVPDLSQRARRIAPLPSCKATNHSHSLIEGGELSWAQSLLRPSQELREGTDKWFLKWAELTLRKCKAGFRMSDLKQP
jgi:hypothetical protein